MKRYAIDLDKSKCVSCGACVVACIVRPDNFAISSLGNVT